MVGFVKLAAASAVLAYGVVVFSGAAPAVSPGTMAKPFQDRIAPSEAPAATRPVVQIARADASAPAGKGDRLVSAECSAQTWPYISPDCASRADGAVQPKQVRVITIESRSGANTSVLARVPQTSVAQR